MRWTTYDSPIGALGLVADADRLVEICFAERIGRLADRRRDDGVGGDRIENDEDDVLTPTARQLGEYFAGTRSDFDLPLGLRGSSFQRRVWSQLLRIPYGETTSYGAVAEAIGFDKTASRAVGLANGRNPIPVVVPCHRVVGANGKLVGYGGGLDRKKYLLTLEVGHTLMRS